MQAHLEQVSIEAERSELESAVEALSRSPRLANLLRYIGEAYFSGQSDRLTEYNIATEVFGRSKTVFDPGEDAIARVEAHRLRKRLKEFYEGPGRDHPIQLSLPSGSYVPVFSQKIAETPPVPAVQIAENGGRGAKPTQSSTPPIQIHPPVNAGAPGGNPPRSRAGKFALASVAALCIGIAGFYARSVFRPAASAPALPVHGEPPRAVSSLPASIAPAAVPLRILAGFGGEPQMDSAGAIWQPDRYGRGGGSWSSSNTAIARTSNQLLFQQWRTGDFTYDIPLRPGVYELHLYFFTTEPSNEDLSTFTVKINGENALTGFDINSDAMGENIADERVFRDLSPASDGFLHLSFASERGAPRLNAIEVLQGTPHALLPIRLIMRRTPFTDSDGRLWHPDDYFLNGRISERPLQTSGASDPNLFTTERYGHFNYAIPVDPRDRYTLVLHFAEFYFGSRAAGGAGSRVFRVMCNGETLLDNFDIYKEAGSLHAIAKTFYHLKPSAQGKLNITFEPINNNATVSGIEVLDESH